MTAEGGCPLPGEGIGACKNGIADSSAIPFAYSTIGELSRIPNWVRYHIIRFVLTWVKTISE